MIHWSLHAHSEHWQHFQSVFLSLAVGQIEHLPRSPVGFEEKQIHYLKTIYVPNDDYFKSVGLKLTNKKIGKIATLYQPELFKNIPRQGAFCTQSVNAGLIGTQGPSSCAAGR
jgi:hypothetical protein